jgi:steroid delta-isomerase-like uncharacterized protein
MSIIARRSAIVGSAIAAVMPIMGVRRVTAAGKSVGQKWIDGWNSPDPEVLVSAFTSDGVYEDVTFGLKKTGSAELRDLHKFFHDSVGGLYVKLIATHVANGHGTIEWLFGGKDVGVFKTGKPFEVQGVSVIEVRGNRISRNLDYYDAATIMKQVGKLPES